MQILHGLVLAQTNLKKLFNKQKHAVRIISDNDRYTPSRPLMKNYNILNIYQLNIYQILTFMFKTKHKTSPEIFHKIFKKSIHKYPTNFATNKSLHVFFFYKNKVYKNASLRAS